MAKCTTHVQGEWCLRESTWWRIKHLLACFTIALVFGAPALADTHFQFERMWPTLQQPWYFVTAVDIAVEETRNVYVADEFKHRIQKFSGDGIYVTHWGTQGAGDGQFQSPQGVDVDEFGNVYVVDHGNHRVEKFSGAGTFVTKWGVQGSGDGQFESPRGVAVDDSGFVYIVDTGNNRIQKFSADGTFIGKWGVPGSDDGQFDHPMYVAIDETGNVYVTDSHNNRIQKFSSEGIFLDKWGSMGEGDGQLTGPVGLSVDAANNLYVVDRNNRIQKFTNDGEFVAVWGEFWNPVGVRVDVAGNVYVADSTNGRIQKFTSDGTFVSQWSSHGRGDAQFSGPLDGGVDSLGNVYIVDANNSRIQKFTSAGVYILQWGVPGSEAGEFSYPIGIAVESGDSPYIYVSDYYNQRIQKFTSSGGFVAKWGEPGSGQGQFAGPWDVAVDSAGNVYVSDAGNYRIQKFNSGGNFILEWGHYGTGGGEFLWPAGMAVDSDGYVYVADAQRGQVQKFASDGTYTGQLYGGVGAGWLYLPFGVGVGGTGNVYVADTYNDRIMKFANDGTFIAGFGESGIAAGQFSNPNAVLVAATGALYVCDNTNNRIQILREVETAPASKAVVVAAGGPFSGNNLWDATQLCANFAYRTLTYQGFTKSRIQYLSSDLDLDLDGNGEADDVDADATNANLQSALTAWATSGGTDDVVLYLVDHGGVGTFRMSGTETLDVAALAGWLNTLDAGITGTLTVVYDACKSGSFLASLSAPGRIILTSASPTEDAFFVTQGVISFSNYFWTEIFNGVSIGEAFTTASNAMSQTFAFQTPLLDDNGNGTGNEMGDGTLAAATYIGNGTTQSWEGPVIGGVFADPGLNGTSEALLWADPVTDTDGVARVWAVLRPPDWEKPGDNNPVTGMPSLDLLPAGGDGYESTYSSFTTPGTYDVLIYARDRIGNTSPPVESTVTVTNPRSRKVLIVAGGTTGDSRWPAIEYLGGLAYESLRFQGYDDSEINYLSQTTTPGVDGLGTLSNIQYACTTWATDATQDFTVYLAGPGSVGAFQVSGTQNLTAAQLDTWLDASQPSIPGKVTVICDADYSGTFLQPLKPPAGLKRITVAGAGSEQSAQFLATGQISFSKYFWGQVADGATVLAAFRYANLAMDFAGNGQRPELDDSGDGIYHTKKDGFVARYYQLGSGITLAGDAPLIASASAPQTIGGSSAPLWAYDVTTTGSISTVYAVVLPPFYSGEARSSSNPVTVTLSYVSGRDYAGTYTGFTLSGAYQIALYAEDIEGAISAPVETYVYRTGAGDADGDGLLDSWETAHGLSTSDATGNNGAEGDRDGDGYTNGDEYLADTDPNDPDSYPPLATAWVDFAHTGDARGTIEDPFATLGAAATQLANGGSVKLRGDSTVVASGEAVTISKAMRLEAVNGRVTIGSP